MREQGSSSSDRVVRVEAYLDDRPEAVQVVTAPPFRFQLDTAALEEGAHSLRLVRVDAAGNRGERRIAFNVEHESGMEVRGLEPGATVKGSVDVDVVVPTAAPTAPAPRSRGFPTWLYLLLTVVILGGIWVFFMVVPIYSNLVSAPSKGGGASAAAPPVDQTLLKAGEQLYTSDCASCHKPSGEGMPPTFPALAGNAFLSDPAALVKRIYDGSGAMPSHHSYSAKMLAEVSTYIRNTWGNSYGGVSVADATTAVPEASSGGSSGSAPQSSSEGSSQTTRAQSGTTAPPASSSAATPAASAAAGANTSAASSGSATPAAGASGSAAMSAGEQLYGADCVSCHRPNGAGMPPTFPALAGNSYLSDPTAVVQRIFDGKGAMPPHPSYTAKQLADVATYIRNTWGNSYGPVSVEQASRAAPKAAQ